MSKICPKCNENKDLSLFCEDKRIKSGYAAICKSCQAVYSISYRAQNKDKIKQHRKEYYKENRDKIISKEKDYVKNNKEKVAKRQREYYELNKEELLEKQKIYNSIREKPAPKTRVKKEKQSAECRKERVKEYRNKNKKL